MGTNKPIEWQAIELGAQTDVYIVRLDAAGAILDAAWAGDATDGAALADELMRARDCGGDLVGAGADDLLTVLPEGDAAALASDLAEYGAVVADADWLDAARVGYLTGCDLPRGSGWDDFAARRP